jgi:hypothetical protein
MKSSHHIAHHARQWGVSFGMVAGAGVAAAMMGVASAPTAHADDADAGQVLDQAAAVMLQAAQTLYAVPADSLDADQAQMLFQQLSFDFQQEAFVLQDESMQAGLSAAAQTSPLVLNADQGLLQAYDAVLSADQAFAAAPPSSPLDDLGLLQAEFGVFPAQFDVLSADIDATLADQFGLSDILQL